MDAPGALHHIIIRGIERRKIFRQDKDRSDFASRLGDILLNTQTSCFAWAFMPNHVHLLLRTALVPIATVMLRLLTGYAVFFNRKYHRHGPLFQNRYKSILCQEDPYLKELVRYIHLNPLRGGVVSDLSALEEYPWCGHGSLLGKTRCEWQEVAYVLGLFGETRAAERAGYSEFVRNGVSRGRRPDLTGGGLIRSLGGWEEVKSARKSGGRLKGDERILGDSDFVEAVLKQADEQMVRAARLRARGCDFDYVLERAAELLKVDIRQVLAGRKSPLVTRARSLVCFWARRELDMTTVEIAIRLGITQPAVSRASDRGEKIASENGFTLVPGRK